MRPTQPENATIIVIAWAAAIAVALLVPGCGSAPTEDALLQAWVHAEADDFGAAFILARDYLLAHPRDPVAHYILGRCYANRVPPELTRAKGEFDMAGALFDADGDLSILETEMTGAAFQARLHYETAVVLLRTAVEAQRAGFTPHASLGILKTALEHARKGLYFDPDSGALANLHTQLQHTIARIEGEDARPWQSPLMPPETDSTWGRSLTGKNRSGVSSLSRYCQRRTHEAPCSTVS